MFPPSSSTAKTVWDFHFNDFICSVFSVPEFASSVDTVERASLV